jgi:hypothetical protein
LQARQDVPRRGVRAAAAPEGGIVTVVYPILFSPGDAAP